MTLLAMANLLTKEEKKALKKEYFTRIAVIISTLLLFSLIVNTAQLLPSYFYSTIAVKIKKGELDSLIKEGEEGEDISKKLKKIDTITAFISGEKDSLQATSVIREVLEDRPAGISLNNFSFSSENEEGVLMLTGKARSRSNLIDFVSSLGKRTRFSAIDVPAENLARAENIDFTIQIIGDF